MTWLFGYTDDGASRTASIRRRRAVGLSIGLLYMIGLFSDVAGYSGVRLFLGVAALLAFATSYYTAGMIRRHWSSPPRARDLVAYGIFVLLTAGLPFAFGADWIGLTIYASVVTVIALPLRWGFPAIVGMTLLALAQTVLLKAGEDTILNLTISTFSVGLMMLAFRHARNLIQQLQEARSEVARLAATEERLRIARDLHDLLGHSLSLIVLKSELARRVADRDVTKAVDEINDIESVARQALADVREAVSGYRQRSLTEELDNARAVLTAAGVRPTIRTSGTPLPDVVDGLLGWAVREGVTNVVRHAHANECTITIGRDGGEAVLELRDDGVGAGPSHTPGNGLTGLTERITAAGGSVAAGPAAGGGFRMVIRTPLQAKAAVESPA